MVQTWVVTHHNIQKARVQAIVIRVLANVPLSISETDLAAPDMLKKH